MGELIQYDFFKTKEESIIEHLEKKCEDLEACLHRVRKGTYAEISRLKSDVSDMKEWRQLMDRHICKN